VAPKGWVRNPGFGLERGEPAEPSREGRTESRPAIHRRYLVLEFDLVPEGRLNLGFVFMADTFFSLNVHCVFSTKNREPLLVGEIKERLKRLLISKIR
jgi:hypothetical protein